MATEAQLKNLEKAREERNKHQALLTQIETLEGRVGALSKLGTLFHDDSASYTAHAMRVNTLRNIWPDMFDEFEKLFGDTIYKP